jgi:hypothetical protein
VFWLFRLVAARRRGGGHRPPMRLCKIGNQQPVELLHVVHTIERCLGRQIIIVLRAQDAVKEPYSAPPPVIDRRCATRRGVYQGWELSVLRVHGGASQSGLGKRCQAGPRRFR